jgi:hypothetical protein
MRVERAKKMKDSFASESEETKFNEESRSESEDSDFALVQKAARRESAARKRTTGSSIRQESATYVEQDAKNGAKFASKRPVQSPPPEKTALKGSKTLLYVFNFGLLPHQVD